MLHLSSRCPARLTLLLPPEVAAVDAEFSICNLRNILNLQGFQSNSFSIALYMYKKRHYEAQWLNGRASRFHTTGPKSELRAGQGQLRP
ncbi:hypothetical protein TNCV_1427171 [Trichonephila clavipes]|nr:hypothetical protein TNCV_1427171 [Trichonephila clavipes]